ncbi:protein of unknown function DUF498 [Ignisphaera aggregans DSM 17230]|uniref:Uncharacterized protein n=1 Tax=Ignisphaera aggregans (strain DSM 17230 / JCM 13409 / AQ1.S1) TaxID=583356 RepID=E0SNQ2_IGNAA|nr:protein of unknown function DUF498 [Ignisphaera aggregans DSM 17230]
MGGVYRQPKIDYYDFGVIVIDNKEYNRDIIISPSLGIIENWWREEGHRLKLIDIRDYLLEKADLVVIGTGYDGMMYVDNEVIQWFNSRGIEVKIARSREAVEIYNKAVEEGKKVLLFIHLTC